VRRRREWRFARRYDSPPTETIPLVLTTNNSGPATELTTTVAVGVLQLGQMASDAVDQLRANPQNSMAGNFSDILYGYAGRFAQLVCQ